MTPLLVLLALVADPTSSQTSFDAVMLDALGEHPRVRACMEDSALAYAQRDERQAQLYPQLNLGVQVNRGTGNVVPGAAWGLPDVPAVAGPPISNRFDGGVWTSIASVGARLDVTGLAARLRAVDAAVADVLGAQATLELCRVDVAFEIASAYVDVVEATAVVETVHADLARAEALTLRTRTLVANALRPGVELARAEAELAAIGTRVARAMGELDRGRARLREALATDRDVPVAADFAVPDDVGAHDVANPRLAAADARISAAQHQRDASHIAYYPRVELVASVWARGSGLPHPGDRDLGSASGLFPDTPNWAAGLVLSWNVFELGVTRARVERAASEARAASARRDVLVLAIAGDLQRADVALRAARAAADSSVPAMTAARTALAQSEARYEAGLDNVVDVARARQALADAELSQQTARADVLRAHLLRARARGDLTGLSSGAH